MTCGGVTRVSTAIAATNAAVIGSGRTRVYTASGRRTGGSGRSRMPRDLLLLADRFADPLVIQHPEAQLCVRAGYIALRKISNVFGIRFDPDPHWPGQQISIAKSEFDEVYDELAREGVPVTSDREQAWRDFAGWRVNYDAVLLALAALTVAPPAKWSSDRSPAFPRLAPLTRRRNRPRR
jgi:hypothetical protein